MSVQGRTPPDKLTVEPKGAGLKSEDVPPGFDRVRLGLGPQRGNCPLLAHQENLGQLGFLFDFLFGSLFFLVKLNP